ncbi:aminotransferase class I/II-fold pyridoxal phosphate-dependent enzyme [Variovorax sp.]|uniref:aminotransferase class I/II-fold pyridoxal phosphate-dependent enzyme n=1 Tax=Variovorax sp. TaxID=1871043 RepID=UPI002D4B80CB|nr:aminotransferase class I/II-fold pyridoxal phosphate-dependent enzyme [Variovorax sp.]HYP86399.1 aminotransferase class I/II-fold pyridoxal phosphate-dependent enzyme [Variovorax sp.]
MTAQDALAHGGPDALGVPAHDFSTNANACGPCPQALAAVVAADAARYPDPAYVRLRARLAAFHGVAVARIHLAASASEFIARMTAAVLCSGGRTVAVPRPGYADYARVATAHGMALVPAREADLVWLCDPGSPSGQAASAPPEAAAHAVLVIDRAYAPLRLAGTSLMLPQAWQLWTPNKALGLTGVRAAYAIAPDHPQASALGARLAALMPSWPIGAHGVALLEQWTDAGVQRWLASSLERLRAWKQQQIAVCESLGWQCLPGETPFFCARPATADIPWLLDTLRAAHGIKLRDAGPLGMPGHVRLNALQPPSQAALHAALRTLQP